MFNAFILFFLVVIASFVAAEQTYFTFKYEGGTGGEFIFKLTDRAKIQQARDILSGAEKDRTHVIGKIIKRRAPYNPVWDFHLDPNSINFFALAIEVCDASISYTNDHIFEACGAFLPSCNWCPWGSILTGEVKR